MAGARKQAKLNRAAAKAGRPAQDGVREPSGRLSRSAKREMGSDSVAEVRRLRSAAMAGMRDPIWGTELGRLFLLGRITGEQFRAGRQWAQLVERWRAIHCGPKINPKSGMATLFRVGGAPGGAGIEDILVDAREQAITGLVDEVLDSFARGPTDPALVALRECCELGIAPVGYGGALLLDDGLSRLVTLWGKSA